MSVMFVMMNEVFVGVGTLLSSLTSLQSLGLHRIVEFTDLNWAVLGCDS